jgi:hypothetical protein
VTATSKSGLSSTATSTYTVLAPPVLGRAHESHRTWTEGKARRGRAPHGTTFSFRLGESARVTLSFTTRVHRHKVTRGELVLKGRRGLNKVAFAGRIPHSHKLRPGRYTVVIAATDSLGQRSKPQSLSFRITG